MNDYAVFANAWYNNKTTQKPRALLFKIKLKKTSFGPRMGYTLNAYASIYTRMRHGFMAEFFKGRFLRTERNFTKKRTTIARINNTFRFYYWDRKRMKKKIASSLLQRHIQAAKSASARNLHPFLSTTRF